MNWFRVGGFVSTLYGVLVEGVSVHFVLVERHKNGLIADRVFPQYTRYGGGEVGDLEQRAVHLHVMSETQKKHTSSMLEYSQLKVKERRTVLTNLLRVGEQETVCV